MSEAEQRSYGWYHYLASNKSNATVDTKYLSLNYSQVGTDHGLSKFPYLRDNRRVKYGIQQFRLTYEDLNYTSPDGAARRFNDTIAIGHYHYADIHGLKNGC